MIRWAVFWAALVIWAGPLVAKETIRIALFDAELRRDGPGLLLRDIQSGKDAQVLAVVEVIATVDPDILVLLSFDWDDEARALSAFRVLLGQAGSDYSHWFSARPNGGLASGLDLDGDGRRGGPGDAQGYGDFTGQSGLAILSNLPIETASVQNFTDLLWRDVPNALMPSYPDGAPFPSQAAQDAQRLSSHAHWAVPVILPRGDVLTVMTFHASPPVFDGREDRNGRRNHDEIAFWQHYLDGEFGPAPDARFVLAGGANLDPFDSDGRREAIQSLLRDNRFQDPQPASLGALEGPGDRHKGPSAQDTVDWTDVGAGRLRVDYVLPSADLTVMDSGVFWPVADDPAASSVETASRHRIVWVDLAVD